MTVCKNWRGVCTFGNYFVPLLKLKYFCTLMLCDTILFNFFNKRKNRKKLKDWKLFRTSFILLVGSPFPASMVFKLFRITQWPFFGFASIFCFLWEFFYLFLIGTLNFYFSTFLLMVHIFNVFLYQTYLMK